MIVLILLFLTLNFFPQPIHAATYNLSISPPVLEILAKPNKSFIQTFTLKNQGSDLKLIPKIIQIKPADNQGHVTLSNLQNVTNLPLSFSLENSDIKLNQPFLLPAHQNQQLVLRLNTATTNQSQDFYLALALIPQNQLDTQPLSQPVLTSLLLITLTPDNNLPINLQLQNFNPPTIHDSTTPLHLQPQLQNHTDIMIRPKSQLTVKNWRNQIAFQTPLSEDLILGHTSRQLHLPKNSTIIWNPPKLAFGPYQLNLSVTSQNNTSLIEETKTVFLFPLKYTVYFFLLIFFIYLLKTSLPPRSPKTE